MQHLQKFVVCEGARYQQLEPASTDLHPRTAPGAVADGLDGWSFMMRTADRGLALLYFEQKAVSAQLTGLAPNARYRWEWFEPRDGRWSEARPVSADAGGVLAAPPFPDGAARAAQDWAAKLTVVP